MKVNPVTRSAL